MYKWNAWSRYACTTPNSRRPLTVGTFQLLIATIHIISNVATKERIFYEVIEKKRHVRIKVEKIDFVSKISLRSSFFYSRQ